MTEITSPEITVNTLWEDLPENVKSWILNQDKKAKEEKAKTIPPEYIFNMAFGAMNIVLERLKDNKSISPDITELCDCTFTILFEMIYSRFPEICENYDWGISAFQENITEMIPLMLKLDHDCFSRIGE